MFSVIKLNVILLFSVTLSVIMLSGVMLRSIMLNAIKLSSIVLSVLILNIVKLLSESLWSASLCLVALYWMLLDWKSRRQNEIWGISRTLETLQKGKNCSNDERKGSSSKRSILYCITFYGRNFYCGTVSWGRIFSHVRPLYKRAVSNLDP
jgi:hypothetical protein